MRAFASQTAEHKPADTFARGRSSEEDAPVFAPAPFSAPGIQRKASCACGGGCPSCQAKSSDLKVSSPNDAAEIEADQIADQVMRMPAGQTVNTNPSGAGQNEGRPIQRKNDPSANAGAEKDTSSLVDKSINSPGRPLDSAAVDFMQPRFGRDLSQVKIHTDDNAAVSARSVNALAYTVGQNIVFGAGQYDPGSESGRRLLAHELAHTAQQSGSGRLIRREIDQEETAPAPETGEAQPAEQAPESGATPQEQPGTTDNTGDPSGDELQNNPICCSNDDATSMNGATFNIDSDYSFDEVCSSTGCVSVTINSRWASQHAARHFRVLLHVFGRGAGGTTITRRYNVGTETQRFQIGKCKSYKVAVQVIDPGTSPNLMGTVSARNC
jgi:hypothetical protein